MTGLTYLELGNNALTGSIPSSVGALTGLTALILSSNALTGPVPASFCSLKPSINLFVAYNPGLTCYPSCLSSYTNFNKGSFSAVCAAGVFVCGNFSTCASTPRPLPPTFS